MKAFKQFPIEALIWTIGLLLLVANDVNQATHFSICPLHNLGFDFCPGCGLGKSISLLAHGKFHASLSAHPLGIFAVVVLTARIFTLTKQYLKTYGQNY